MTEKQIIKKIYVHFWIIRANSKKAEQTIEKARKRGFWIDFLLGPNTARITKAYNN